MQNGDDPSAYEAHMVLSDSAPGRHLASCMSASWASQSASIFSSFEAQEAGWWCAFASLRIALRVLAASGTTDSVGLIMSQRELAAAYIERSEAGGGVSLAMLEAFVRSLSVEELLWPAVDVQCVKGEAHSSLVASLRDDLERAETDGSVLLVNILRLLGGHRTGHWSVLAGLAQHGPAAYALVLDVAAHKVQPHWLPLSFLARCICTRNSLGRARGYLRLSLSSAAAAPVRASEPSSIAAVVRGDCGTTSGRPERTLGPALTRSAYSAAEAGSYHNEYMV